MRARPGEQETGKALGFFLLGLVGLVFEACFFPRAGMLFRAQFLGLREDAVKSFAAVGLCLAPGKNLFLPGVFSLGCGVSLGLSSVSRSRSVQWAQNIVCSGQSL